MFLSFRTLAHSTSFLSLSLPSSLFSFFSLSQEAASLGADVVVLPEMWHCPYGNDSFPLYAEEVSVSDNNFGSSESARALSEAAATSGVAVVGGSISEKEANAIDPSLPPKLFNTCLVFGPDGKLLAKHRKAHLFDIDIPGKITFLESETLAPGGGATTVDVPCPKRKTLGPSSSSAPAAAASASASSPPPPVVRLGIGICYDLRFPDYASVLTRRGAQVLIYPGAFSSTTGPAHWELLARARAVDSQAFVALCSPARISEAEAERVANESGGKKKPYVAHGHSLAVSPWGEVLVDAGAEPVRVVTAELDLAEVETRRRNMPLADQRRWDLYELVDKGRR